MFIDRLSEQSREALDSFYDDGAVYHMVDKRQRFDENQKDIELYHIKATDMQGKFGPDILEGTVDFKPMSKPQLIMYVTNLLDSEELNEICTMKLQVSLQTYGSTYPHLLARIRETSKRFNVDEIGIKAFAELVLRHPDKHIEFCFTADQDKKYGYCGKQFTVQQLDFLADKNIAVSYSRAKYSKGSKYRYKKTKEFKDSVWKTNGRIRGFNGTATLHTFLKKEVSTALKIPMHMLGSDSRDASYRPGQLRESKGFIKILIDNKKKSWRNKKIWKDFYNGVDRCLELKSENSEIKGYMEDIQKIVEEYK